MGTVEFESPVRIYFGKPGCMRTVSSLYEAEYCLKSEKWPGERQSKWRHALAAIDAAKVGRATPADACNAFRRAAKEARILAICEKVE